MAGRQTNFKTDVNRMKTQKWAQASKANYGGDDWGGYDDYDDYEEEPPPPPKPTGLRQRGQGTATSSPDQSNFVPEHTLQAAASTVPQAQAAAPSAGRPRAGSFETGDDSHLLKDAPEAGLGGAAPHPASQPQRLSAQSSASSGVMPQKPASQASSSPGLSQPESSNDRYSPAPPSYLQSQGPPQQKSSFQPQAPRSPPIMQGPYTGPGSSRPQPNQPPPRGESRGQPPVGSFPQPGPGQMAPPGAHNRPPPGQNPNLGGGRPYAPGMNPPKPSSPGPHARRERTPPSATNPSQPDRPRQPPPQNYGPRKRPSQEYAPRRAPSGEFRSGQPPPQELRPRQSPSQEFRPPPRKESLSSSQRPSIPPTQGAGPPNIHQSSPHGTPDRRPSPNVPSPREESAPSAATFVRPADIYRRVEAEKERARQSTDSSRPSLDSLELGGRPTSRGQAAPYGSQVSGADAGLGSSLKPTLDPVAERKSEYGLEGLMAKDPAFANALGTQIDAKAPPADPPSLPQFERFSSFGMDDFMGDSKPSAPSADKPINPRKSATAQAPGPESTGLTASTMATETPGANSVSQPMSDAQQDDLQHQPSVGFRSAVNQAFEGDNQSTLSPTHTSRGSRSGSDVSRSNTTDSTAGISPIMSRVPSAATAERRYREADVRMTAPEAIQEEAHEASPPDSRPTSISTLKGAQPTSAAAGDDHSRNASQESVTLKAGYRRSMRPPSPGNSPAHVTAFSARKAMEQHSQEGEIAVATPVDVSRQDSQTSQGPSSLQQATNQDATDLSTRESDLAATATAERKSTPVANAEANAQNSFIEAHKPISRPTVVADSSEQDGAPESRSGSPSKGRVRDLASKYNDIHGTTGARASSPSGSVASWASSNKASPVTGDTKTIESESPAATAPSRKSTSDLAPPARPMLPGGWVSYNPSEASETPSLAPSNSDNHESALEQEPRRHSVSQLATPKIDRQLSDESVDLAPTTVKRPLSGKTYPVTYETPVAALSAAGAALADSLQNMLSGSEDGPSEDEAHQLETRTRSTTGATLKPDVASPDDIATSASSTAPTPPLKDLPHNTEPKRTSGYFPAATPLNVQKAVNGPSKSAVAHEPDSATTVTSVTSTHLSLESSAGDTEADRLRKDIARSLSPPEISDGGLGALPTVDERQSGVSSILPHEYDIYWANRGSHSSLSATNRMSDSSQKGTASSDEMKRSEAPDVEPLRTPGSPTSHESPIDDTRNTTDSPKLDANKVRDSISKGELERTSDNSEPAELDSNSNAAHVVPPSQEIPLDPVELPTSDDHLPKAQTSTDKSLSAAPMAGRKRADPATARNHPKPASLRDIMNIKGQRERISAFSAARNQFGEQSTGLNDWLAFMVDQHPEYAKSVAAPMRPLAHNAGIAGSVRNKMPPSIAKLGKTSSGGMGSLASTPESGSPSSIHGRNGPTGSKRQEFLHNANVFGGKASQGAKGLFAKGKSRFRGVSSEKEISPPPTATRASNTVPSPFRSRSHIEPTNHERALSRPFDTPQQHDKTRDGDTASQPGNSDDCREGSNLFGGEPKSERMNDGESVLPRTIPESPKPDVSIIGVPLQATNPAHTTVIHEPSHVEALPSEIKDAAASDPQPLNVERSGRDAASLDPPAARDVTWSDLEVVEGPNSGPSGHQDRSQSPHQYDSEKIVVSGPGQYGIRGSAIWDNEIPRTATERTVTSVESAQSKAPSRRQSQASASEKVEHVHRNNTVQPPMPAQPYGYWRHGYDTPATPSRSQSTVALTSQRDPGGAGKVPGEMVDADNSTNLPRSSQKMSMDTRRPSLQSQSPRLRGQETDSSYQIPPIPQLYMRAAENQSTAWNRPVVNQSVALNSERSQHQRAMSQPVTKSTATALPPLNLTERGKRHYASENAGATVDHGTTLPDELPPIPQKSRNRLSKRHSSKPPQRVVTEGDQAADIGKKKRSSFFGSILRRSSTPKTEASGPPPNRLKKADSHKSRNVSSERYDTSDMPPLPMRVRRPPKESPQLPNIDGHVENAGHAAVEEDENEEAISASVPPEQESADYYRPELRPAFEAPAATVQVSPAPTPPLRDPGRAHHISFLQSQDMFGARQSPMAADPLHETSALASQAVPQSQRLAAPQRIPSASSSVYTAQRDDSLQHNLSDASSHYKQAGDFAHRPTRPLTQAYTQFSRGPYDESAPQQTFEQPLRRQTAPPAHAGHGYFPPPPQPGLAHMYADARRPRGH